MNNFGIEAKVCNPAEQGCNEKQRNLAMELKKAADAGDMLSNMTDQLYCVLFGGEMDASNGCPPANSLSDALDRHVDTLCRTCEMMERILTMVGP